jgi:hypothetical protein
MPVLCPVLVCWCWQAGYPLVTVLVCLVDADNYVKLVDSMADFLLKQMKAKEYRWVGMGGGGGVERRLCRAAC